MNFIDRSKTYGHDRAQPGVFGKLKRKAFNAVKSVAIALTCMTAGVAVGTAAHANTAPKTLRYGDRGSIVQSGQLHLKNDTISPVIIFIHKHGETSTYSSYAYLPGCTDRTMSNWYSTMDRISQDLTTKISIGTSNNGNLEVRTSSFPDNPNALCAPRPIKFSINRKHNLSSNPSKTVRFVSATVDDSTIALPTDLVEAIPWGQLEKYVTQGMRQLPKVTDFVAGQIDTLKLVGMAQLNDEHMVKQFASLGSHGYNELTPRNVKVVQPFVDDGKAAYMQSLENGNLKPWNNYKKRFGKWLKENCGINAPTLAWHLDEITKTLQTALTLRERIPSQGKGSGTLVTNEMPLTKANTNELLSAYPCEPK